MREESLDDGGGWKGTCTKWDLLASGMDGLVGGGPDLKEKNPCQSY